MYRLHRFQYLSGAYSFYLDLMKSDIYLDGIETKSLKTDVRYSIPYSRGPVSSPHSHVMSHYFKLLRNANQFLRLHRPPLFK